MKPPEKSLHLTIRQVQKHFYRYVRLVGKGTCIRICASRRKSDPLMVMVPYGWYVEAVGLDAWPTRKTWIYGFAASKRFDETVLAGMVAGGMTREEAVIALLEEGLRNSGYPIPENHADGNNDAPPQPNPPF